MINALHIILMAILTGITTLHFERWISIFLLTISLRLGIIFFQKQTICTGSGSNCTHLFWFFRIDFDLLRYNDINSLQEAIDTVDLSYDSATKPPCMLGASLNDVRSLLRNKSFGGRPNVQKVTKRPVAKQSFVGGLFK